ncbi:Ubiquitin-conjugating enzyme E2 [Penicillium hispanicum]|uniref:Ubiquitin-conjugating enzyme E2 n=1 Tax=Penicillium hispanicum TaxID=1080232 RepID=UPI002541F120|nr:Ubiquitin-conjugating enzyme E2 [Penicillium hispanicum]KAJ5578018.1 Ubiquitin-conjugating enzyme E2 [Penicillium hispanicum]
MPSNLRRLAADHAALHGSQLPPYYLLPSDDGRFTAADDLSQLTVLLTGPQGTPYSQGLWRLHLKMPEDYPHSPPKATFRTRIWHPNVEEQSGAVCVDTLKRDWQSKLTLRDVLITISCLLIHPNPDSALNSESGTLLREDYEAFAHQAKLMTSIHAPIPGDQKHAVHKAKYRGEDADSIPKEKDETTRPRKLQRIQTSPAKRATRKTTTTPTLPHPPSRSQPQPHRPQPISDEDDAMNNSENDDPASASKENNPSLSPTPVRLAPASPRKNALGKRPLSVLSTPYPEDPDADMMLVDSDTDADARNDTAHPTISPSDQNIGANNIHARAPVSPQRKPKVAPSRGVASYPHLRHDLQIYEDVPDRTRTDSSPRFGSHGKENQATGAGMGPLDVKQKHELHTGKAGPTVNTPTAGTGQSIAAPAPAPTVASSRVAKKAVRGARKGSKPKPRIGVRRL